jgi:hypothetical protein
MPSGEVKMLRPRLGLFYFYTMGGRVSTCKNSQICKTPKVRVDINVFFTIE